MTCIGRYLSAGHEVRAKGWGTGPEYSLFEGSGKIIDRLKGSKFENAVLNTFYESGEKKLFRDS